MSIEVADLLGLAQQLSSGNSECEWRSGASRAYYAAYHKALSVADRCLPQSPVSAGQHERLTDRYKAEGTKGKALAYMLIDLKRVRTHADYRLSSAFSQHDATDLLAKCIAFIPTAEAFQSDLENNQSVTL
ncbi:hypothetical protein [Caballeronia cordobensis]|uniref:hypothetical protein n=1 Tax=Caballeronia cordobensis TaxID=1353886 RepID=UPI00045F0116|nr:putative membrane protein [Burkholderia sp. RPE67]